MGNISVGEGKIINILNKNGVFFQKECTFTDLKKGLYRYDFYIPSLNVLIEYNGAQHYEFTSFFYKKRSDFQKAQERDRRKIAYALANNIKLFIIPYWNKDKINELNDLFKKEYLADNKFFNDKQWREYKKAQS